MRSLYGPDRRFAGRRCCGAMAIFLAPFFRAPFFRTLFFRAVFFRAVFFPALFFPALFSQAISFPSGSLFADDAMDPAKLEFFETNIRPVLVQQCYECHSEETEEPEGDFLLDTRDTLRRGGPSGPAVVPGDPDASVLISALRHDGLEMPPDGQLSDVVISNFVRWIEEGAVDPREHANSSQTRAKGSPDHWSFQPVRRPPIPQLDSDWPHTDIDRFVLARMQSDGIHPVTDADPQTLIRRVYFALIGLPPSPEAVVEFQRRSRRDARGALRELVDRLLNSPEFGIRWGRHWLDVVRFAESTGFERNFTFPHAWRYRDYVVESFNTDKPYDQFVREQIAGDLLPAADERQAQQQQMGTGMLALGPKDLLGNTARYPLDVADDQIDVVGRAILGLTVACARCHDHKFDPISTREYYSLAGIFLSTETMYGTNPGSGGGSNRFPSDLLPVGPDALAKHEAYQAHKAQVDALTLSVGKASSHLKKLRDQKVDPQDTTRAAREKEAVDEVKRLQQQLVQLKERAPEPPGYAMAVREAKQPVEAAIRLRGVATKKGPTVPRGVLEVVTKGAPPPIDASSSGRLELAHWLATPKNPLTARVMVNRIWHHLLGRGLVETVDNFGFNGSKPSHPELLDHLATRFVDQGWSVKALIREIMASRVYQLSSRHDAKLAAMDGEVVTLWRAMPRRLEAEVIRDAMMWVSGELTLNAPAFGSIVAQMGDGCLVRQVDAEKLYVELPNRSIYLPSARHFALDIFQVFDGPAASLVSGKRDTTNVPAQSLFLLNNSLVVNQANKAGRRLLRMRAGEEELDDRQRIHLAYWLAFGRSPTEVEADLAESFIENSMREIDEAERDQQELAVWAAFCQSIFAAAEFRTVY